jgi:hypothetical protein
MLVWLISVQAFILACPLVVVAMLSRDTTPREALLAVIAIPTFVLGFFALTYVAWRAVRVYEMPKTDAWWWLSAPYSVAFASYFKLLNLERFAVHALPVFTYVFVITVVSTAIWTVVALYQVASSRRLPLSRAVMLAFALVLALVLWTLRVGSASP